MAGPKQKVVVLGGGIGAMTVAWELSSGENRDKYDITVYQMGWRLGGQGASGRNQQRFMRIEEHGLHCWGGFYENAFRIMAEVYAELGRPAGTPLSRLWDPGNPEADDIAYTPHDNVVFCEYVNNKWIPWACQFAREAGMPGEKGNTVPSLQDLLYRAIELFLSVWKGIVPAASNVWAREAIDDCAAIAEKLAKWCGVPSTPTEQTDSEFERVMESLRNVVTVLAPELHNKVIADLLDFLNRSWERFMRAHEMQLGYFGDDVRRSVILLDFLRAVIFGVVNDGVLTDGFVCIEKYDFRDWLQRNGAATLTLDSVLVRGFYDYLFSFDFGDPGRPSLSAGTAICHAIRLTLTYRHAVFFRMEAGMGDTVFAPFYLTLKKRGVKFKFFHRVDDLISTPAADAAGRPKITTIRLTRQVELLPDPVNRPDGEYYPLIEALGLACWPSLPLIDQIKNGPALMTQLQDLDLDLEVPAIYGEKQWQDEQPVTLTAGVDFDIVVSNLSVAALGHAIQGLNNLSLSIGMTSIRTVPTMAVQVWMNKGIQELGWDEGSPVLTGYQRPTSTWGEMTYLLKRELSCHLPAPQTPKSLAYFCGPLCDSMVNDAAVYCTAEGRRAFDSRVKAVARQWFQDNAWQLFPNATVATNPTALDYNVLWSSNTLNLLPVGITTLDHSLFAFDQQYIRGNIKPAERYVIATPGDNKFRPREGESGVDGLFFVGDWIYTALGGCVESAAMAGLMVARRITGQDIAIFGELPEMRLGFRTGA